MGRVAMALLGDAAQVEAVLEQVARDLATKPIPVDTRPIVWLLGLVRSASAVQLAKIPRRTRPGKDSDSEPSTERMGAALEAIPARAALATLKPTEREAVVLHLVGGLDAAEVAIACNTEVGTVKTRIARGLEQLLLGVAMTSKGRS